MVKCSGGAVSEQLFIIVPEQLLKYECSCERSEFASLMGLFMAVLLVVCKSDRVQKIVDTCAKKYDFRA